VPNHTGLGHPWIETHPDYFVPGSEQDLQRQPQNFVRVETRTGPRIFAYGRDPNFDGWPDTLQLDYGNPDLQDARIAELLDIAGQCDGVRCDMVVATISVGGSSEGVAITPNGRFVYVTNPGSNTVSVIATASKGSLHESALSVQCHKGYDLENSGHSAIR
jgi:hypothetical protein